MASTTINLTTLTIGQHIIPLTAQATKFTNLLVTLDRTVTNGLNVNPTSTFGWHVDASTDGGVTWIVLTGSSFPGGILHNDDGSTVTSQVDSSNWPAQLPTAQMRVVIDVAGHSVAVAGSVVAT